MGEPCGWSVSGTGCGCGSGGKCWTGYSPATRARASALAAHFLWAATGRRYGLCEVTVLPCTPPQSEPLYQEYGPPFAGPNSGPYLSAGTWLNAPTCGPGCSCTGRCEVSLPGPIDSVVEVLIDGEAVSPEDYAVYDRTSLARLCGGCWPSCQNWALDVPHFAVTYLLGTPIPTAVQYGFDTLACQFAKGCEGGECALPSRLQSLTRQGVTLDLAVDQAATQGGGKLRTGILAVDQVIEADNPAGLTQAPTVISLDMPQPRVLTWGGGS